MFLSSSLLSGSGRFCLPTTTTTLSLAPTAEHHSAFFVRLCATANFRSHASSYIQLGGEISFCLGKLCHLTPSWEQPCNRDTLCQPFWQWCHKNCGLEEAVYQRAPSRMDKRPKDKLIEIIRNLNVLIFYTIFIYSDEMMSLVCLTLTEYVMFSFFP